VFVNQLQHPVVKIEEMHGMVEDRVELDAVGQNVIWTHRFKSMLNFRRLISTRIPDDISEEGRSMGSRPLNLFRSSRPDHLTAEEVDMFVQLNIRSVIDLRSASEYRKSDGAKLLDAVYPAYKVLGLLLVSKTVAVLLLLGRRASKRWLYGAPLFVASYPCLTSSVNMQQ